MVSNVNYKNEYSIANDGVIQFTGPELESSVALANSVVKDFGNQAYLEVGAGFDMGEAGWTAENGYIQATRAKIYNGTLHALGLGKRDYASLLFDRLSNGTYQLHSPEYAKRAILRKFDRTSIAGVGEPLFTENNIAIPARSVAAKATKNATLSLAGLADAIIAIQRLGGTPVVVTPSKLALTMLYTSDASVQYQQVMGAVPIIESRNVVATYVFAKELFITATLGTAFVDVSNSFYDPFANGPVANAADPITTTPNGNAITGVNAWTQAKIGSRVLAIMDYNYLGDSDTAFQFGTEPASTTQTETASGTNTTAPIAAESPKPA